nr:hypothetical protein [Bacteroidota bacterium]
MFEIDRPLQTKETFALVISEKYLDSGVPNEKVSPLTCAIGRDLTTYNSLDFADTLNPNGFTIEKFIWDDNDKKPIYLSKYYDGKLNNSNTYKSLTVAGINYKILPLNLYFETVKKKWFAIMAFDQDKLRKLEQNSLNAYNPFLKFVAVRYSEQSTTNNFNSELTQPKYINILSERVISIKEAKRKFKCWTITIDNYYQIKSDNAQNIRTYFALCIRRKSVNGINGEVLLTKDDLNKESKFHIIENGKIDFPHINNVILCVYEFESFDNNIIDISKINWLDENKLRLIYAEDFQ